MTASILRKQLQEGNCVCHVPGNLWERWGWVGEEGSAGRSARASPPPQTPSLVSEPLRGRGAAQPSTMETK